MNTSSISGKWFPSLQDYIHLIVSHSHTNIMGQRNFKSANAPMDRDPIRGAWEQCAIGRPQLDCEYGVTFIRQAERGVDAPAVAHLHSPGMPLRPFVDRLE